ncbi:putative diacylglycerol O-acyltransferase [invertebrate metagenome]|uniref:diacylglycerol O-acyltransferase n=1 Tax=invertebrate metagenome TaxID=1711999 RepID=A0A2H9TCE6_9ZZZZ
MKQLSALDTIFFNMETHTTPMHVGCVAIYDASSMPKGTFDFADVLNNFSIKMAELPVLRQRRVNPPMGIDYPYWISDPDFNLEYHLRQIALPQPGNWEQLCERASAIQAEPLDLEKPPWEIYIVTGLNSIEGVPEGSFALISKMHHALIDGVRGAQLLAAMHDLSPRMMPHKKARGAEPIVVERMPTGIELLSRAALHLPTNIMAKAKATSRYAMPLVREMANKILDTEKHPWIPKTRFNHKVTGHRVFDAIDFKLNEIKALRSLLPGSTINDIMVAIISGGLHHYLKGRSELPANSMNAMVPVNVMPGQGMKQDGNHISFMFPLIHSNEADPVKRLTAIHFDNEKAKSNHKRHGGKMLMDSTHLLPTTLTHMVLDKAVRYNLIDKIKPLINTVITNVPGPQLPLYHAGAKMLRFYGMGVCYDSMGLFHIIFSYNGVISISFTSCQRMMPDQKAYVACLRRSFKELKKCLPVDK